jgi:hypothetical protein
MHCYAKDMQPGFLLNGHEEGWLEVLSVNRDSSKTREAVKNPYGHDMTIVFLHRMTGKKETFRCNAHAIFTGIIAE